MTLAIQTHQSTRRFNDFRAVNGIDLVVERRAFHGFLGPDAAGSPLPSRCSPACIASKNLRSILR